MSLKLIAAQKTDVGKQREQNEDNVFQRIEKLEDGDYGLFVVADGMGGYKAGEVASQLAVEKISQTLASFFKPRSEQTTIRLNVKDIQQATPNDTTTPETDPDATVKLPKPANEVGAQFIAPTQNSNATVKFPESLETLTRETQLKEAIQAANRAILQYGDKQSSARGLGCTVTTALVEKDKVYIANVGDSRTYLFRNKKLKAITRDHSLVARLVESKQIEPEDVYAHPQRNLIYRSLGAGHKTVEVDTFSETLEAGDMLLLCSDGLWEMVHDADLEKVLREQSDPQKMCDMLIDLANDHGGEDNITALVVQVGA